MDDPTAHRFPDWVRGGDSAGGEAYAEGGSGGAGGHGEGGGGGHSEVHLHGLTPGQGLAIAGLAAAALAAGIVNMVMDSNARADMRSRYEESINELRGELLKSQKEAKQVQVQLMYTNALMIREGMVKPGDMVFGPEGNLEYDGTKFKLPKEK